MRTWSLILLGFVVAVLLFAVNKHWVGATPQAVTPTNGLYFIDENRGWVVGNGGLIVRTVNSGDAWEVQPSGTSKDLYEVQFVDANTGWTIGAGGTILHTTDGGAHWQPQASPAAVDLHGLFMLNSQVGWIGFPDGVLKTTNGGNTWTKTGIGVTFQVRVIQFLDANKGFLISSDLDINYELLSTTNGGETWTRVNISWNRFVDLYFLNPTFGVMSEKYGDIYITRDGGANWQLIDWLGSSIYLEAIYFFDVDHGWAVGENSSWSTHLLRTTNSGQNWSKLTGGGKDLQFVSLLRGFTASDDGIKRSTDGGYNWTLVYPTPQPTPTPTTVSAPLKQTNGMDFIDENRGWAVGNGGLIVHTVNSGDTWEVQPSGITKDLYEVQFVDANNGWAIGAGGTILHTSNGGATWQAQTSAAAVDLHGLFMFNSQVGWIGFPDGVLKTTNGGSTWTKTGIGVTFQVRVIQFLDANKGFLISSDLDINYELLSTTNGGETWTRVNISWNRFVDLYFLNPTFGVMIERYGDIYITRDGGANWQLIDWLGSSIYLDAIYFFDVDHGWAVGENSSWSTHLLRTTNGGQNWSKLTGGGSDVQFVSPLRGFVASDDGIKRSIDGGYNWTLIYPTSIMLTPTSTPTSTSTPTQTPTPTSTSIQTPPICYPLTLTTSGSGGKPVASPDHSVNCAAGRYIASELINLQASPAPSWQVISWLGTNHNSSTLTTNTLTMPANAHTVTVNYGQAPASIAPLPLGCSSVTPTGEPQTTLCLSGLVYWNGQPMSGATVEIEDAQGQKVPTMTQTYRDAETRPHYRLNLSGPPLSLENGESITITARYANLVRTVEHIMQSGSQQIDIVLPANAPTFTRPLATITHIAAINIRQGDTLRARGMGQDSDASPELETYRWSSDKQGELGMGSALEIPTQAFNPGVHRLSFAVKDTEGEWSDPVTTEIYVAPAVQPSWTALLYLAGDYQDGEQLYRRFDATVRTLRTKFANPNVQIAVQIDGPLDGDTRRFLIRNGSVITPTVTEKAMDDPTVLVDFVRWGQQELPAQRYYLAIANHGQAVRGIAWDTTSDLLDNGVHDKSAFLTVAEVAEALAMRDLAPIDLLHLDACSMNLVETGFELRKVAKFLISSQYLGWNYFPYDQYLQKIETNTTAEAFARTVVDQYAQIVQHDGHPYTIAALRLDRAEPVLHGVNALAEQLIKLVESKQLAITTLDTIWQQSGKFESNGDYLNNNDDIYIDLDDWLKRLRVQIQDQTLQGLANQLIAELAPYELFILSTDARSGPLLPRYANGERIDLSYANGISIYYPKRHDDQTFDNYINHRLFSFTRYSQWPTFLVIGAGPLPDPTLRPAPGPLEPLDATRYLYLPVIQQ